MRDIYFMEGSNSNKEEDGKTKKNVRVILSVDGFERRDYYTVIDCDLLRYELE